MRTAYSGRAAAHAKKGDHAKALADHNMVVTFYAVEAEILDSLDAPNRDTFLLEAAQAYRARSRCLEALGRQQAAQVDNGRADAIAAKARKLARTTARRPAASPEPIQIVNGWPGRVTLTAGSATYRLEAGEQKAIPAPARTLSLTMQAGPYQQTLTLEAGKTYTIRTPEP